MTSERAETILNGFQINWIKLTNADDGKIIWHEAKDFSDSKEMHEARVPTSILDVRAILREINFSSVEELKNFRIVQMAKFKGKLLEQWAFTMGGVKPCTTNSWISTIEAAPESQMMPAKVLNGNVTIETEFYDDEEKFATSIEIYLMTNMITLPPEQTRIIFVHNL